MGQQTDRQDDRVHVLRAARTPAMLRSPAPSISRATMPRASWANGRGAELNALPLDLMDTSPRPVVSGALALLPQPGVEPAPRTLTTRRSILIVEDDPRTAHVLRSALELEGEAGWEIEVAGEGMRALELAARTPPDLVLLDVRLPGMDGAEVYRRLRASPHGSRIHILFLSAGTSLDLYQRGIDDGVLLRKPFDIQDLLGLVRALFVA